MKASRACRLASAASAGYHRSLILASRDHRVSRKFLSAVAGMALAGAGWPAHAQSNSQEAGYPARSVRVIVTATTGGSTDIVARIVSLKLSAMLQQQFIVDNRPGAGGIIGTEVVANANPDGHTLLFAWANHTITPLLTGKVPYDPVRDFAPVSLVAIQPLLLIVNGTLPVSSVKELVALAKAKPDQLREGVAGVGGVGQIAGEIFKLETGSKITAINYKGAAPAQLALLQNEVQLTYVSPVSAIADIKAGRIKALGTSGNQRLALLPDVPTFNELGLPNLNVNPWQGVFVPAKTPRPIIDKLQRSIVTVLNQPDTIERLVATGSLAQSSTPEELGAKIKKDIEYFGRIIKAANIKLE
jgi:tripartite-type tricarboxylate transporter receptor subunit TctC